MKRGVLSFLLILFAVSEAKASRYIVDSLNRKQGISLLVSLKPVFNWISKKDSADNFLYSNVRIEVQYHFKKHMLGAGFNGNHQRYLTPVNGLPNTTEKTRFSFAPYYSYQFYSVKRWKAYAGLAYLYNYDKDLKISQSNIENISKSTLTISEGAGLFFRVNYSFNKHLSMELEMAFYSTRMRQDILEDYPLTPSLNSLKSNYLVSQTYSFPSNLFIKYSF